MSPTCLPLPTGLVYGLCSTSSCHNSSCSILCPLLKQVMKTGRVTKEAHHSNQREVLSFEWQNPRGISLPKNLVHLHVGFCKMCKNTFVLSKFGTLFRMSEMSHCIIALVLAMLIGMLQVMSNQLRSVYPFQVERSIPRHNIF